MTNAAKRDRLATPPGVVWEGLTHRLLVAEGRAVEAIYCLSRLHEPQYRNPEWVRVDYSSRETLAKIVADYGNIPGLAGLIGILPDDPALASKAFWRARRARIEDLGFVPGRDVEIGLELARLHAMEQAAILERGAL